MEKLKIMKKIFCVEDDINIRELIEYTLKQAGFEAKGFESAEDFYAALQNDFPDLILLDIMLPDKDGLQILKELKASKKTSSVPVIFLTAKSDRLDTVKGLDSGADDYIKKPFDILELVSRINAVLRRVPQKEQANNISYKNISIDPDRRIVFANGKEISLTYKEFELLYYLVSNKGMVLSRDKIMNEVWGTYFEGESRTVDVHIRSLRQKLEEAGEYIETVRNVGYKIN